jgi:hypothetical protein
MPKYNADRGEVAERFKAAVLKTVEGNPLPGFESLPLRQILGFVWYLRPGDKIDKNTDC